MFYCFDDNRTENSVVITLAYDTKEEVMVWMITYQDVRRNMCETEKIYANDKVSVRRIEEENAKKKLESNRKGADITNGKTVSVHLDGERKSHTSPTHTREQRAKIAGVSAGTVARYNTKEEAMKWMLDIQLDRRNLPLAQRLAVMDKFKKKIQEQAANKANESRSKFHGNQYKEVSSPNGDHTKIKTDKELAKMAGVSTDTYSKRKKFLIWIIKHRSRKYCLVKHLLVLIERKITLYIYLNYKRYIRLFGL